MKRIAYILFLLCSLVSGTVQAEDLYEKWNTPRGTNWGFLVRTGYVLGGTSPMPLPAEVRSIGRYNPEGGWTLSADFYNMFNKRCGIMTGIHYFMEGMNTGATVKNYKMGIQMGEDYLEGMFTGTDETKTFMSGFTVPVLATFRVSPRWNINIGPYVSFLMYRDFEGSVYDGYLRVGNPTGEKVEISRENPATYNFEDNMRRVLWGVEIGADWKITRRFTAFANLDWGMNSVFKGGFQTIDFPMYPLYATFGVAYLY